MDSRTKKYVSTRTSVSTSSETKELKPPKGAIIIEKNITTSTEEIENGFIITKSVDGRYKMKEGGPSEWFNYSKKTYSEEDPFILKSDKSLADDFN